MSRPDERDPTCAASSAPHGELFNDHALRVECVGDRQRDELPSRREQGAAICFGWGSRTVSLVVSLAGGDTAVGSHPRPSRTSFGDARRTVVRPRLAPRSV